MVAGSAACQGLLQVWPPSLSALRRTPLGPAQVLLVGEGSSLTMKEAVQFIKADDDLGWCAAASRVPGGWAPAAAPAHPVLECSACTC